MIPAQNLTRLFQIVVVSLGLSAIMAACSNKNDDPGRSGTVVATGSAEIGGPFSLVNQDGLPVTQDDIQGKPQLIYFGFAYCPDVCPLALQQMGAALDAVDPSSEFFQPIFISVDPERDTPDMLKLYVSNNGFPKNLMGLTGSAEQVEAAKSVYKIYSQKIPDPDGGEDYTVDHLSLIYLMDKKGKFVDVFTHASTTEDITRRLKAFKKRND